MKGRRRIPVVMLAAVIFCMGGMKVRAYAGALQENVESEGECAAYGILVIENQQRAGSVELEYEGHKELIACDYSEFEIPIDEKGQLRILEKDGYQVSAVKADGQRILGEENVYEWSMDREFLTLTVEYTAVGSSESEGDTADFQHPKEEELVSANDKKEIPLGASVSAITYEAEVTYLEEEALCLEEEEYLPEVIEVKVENFEKMEPITVPEVNLPENFDVEIETAPQGETVIFPEREKQPKREESEREPRKPSSKPKKEPKKRAKKKVKAIETERKISRETEEPEESRVAEEEKITMKQQSLVTFPNLSLYIVAICCIMSLKKILKLDKKG